MENGFYTFSDFLDKKTDSIKNTGEESYVEKIINPEKSKRQELIKEEFIEEKEEEKVEQQIEDENESENDVDGDYYKLYQDKNEEFSCEILIEGSSVEDTYTRIIIESENWSLVFDGEIKNGKCVVPIKKLAILKEGEVGKIKLEVITEGNLFVPWESKYKVKLSKKVTVKMNESKLIKETKNKIGVKVNVK